MLKINSKKIVGLLMAFAFVFAASANALTTTTAMKISKTSSKADVMWIQEALNTFVGTTLAVDGKYGPKTTAAIKAFQVANPSSGIADGIAGKKTLAALNARVAGGASSTTNNGTTVATGTGVNVALSADNTASSTLTAGSAFNTVLKFNVSNATSSSVNVTSVKVTKFGNLGNTLVTGVAVFDGNGVRHGNVVTTLGADGVATIGLSADPIMVSAGQSMPVSIKVNLDSSAAVSFGMKIASASDITLSTGSVGGTFPLMGNQMFVEQSSSLATVTLDVQPVNASGTTVNADGTSSYEVTKFRVAETSSNEAVNLKSLTLWNNGNAADTDLKNIQLVDQTGTVVATAEMMNKYVKFNLATPYVISKGQTKDFTVRATFVNGASRTAQFVVYDNYDLVVTGAITGTSMLASAAGGVDSTFPIGDTTSTYNKVTIGSGSLIFNRATDSSASAVVPGANDVVLAKYNVKPVGENVELRAISFGLDQNTGSVNLTGTVFVKVNGSVVYSAAANTTNFAADGTVASRSLSSYPVLTAGMDNTIEVSASISSSATTSDAYFVNDFDITSVKRLMTNDITDPSVSPQDGFNRAVQAAALVAETLSTPVATSVVAGTNNFKLATFEFNAQSSGEDVRVSSITVTDTLGSGSDYSGVSNLVLKDASGNQITTTASTSTNANTVAFNFSQPITVTRTSAVSLSLYGDILSSTGTSHTYKLASASSVTSVGLTTGNSITETGFNGAGQTMTVVSGGTLTLSTVSGAGYTPSVGQNVLINQVDGTYLAGRFTSQYEGQKITSLTLEAAGTSLNSNNIKNIRLYAQNGTGALLGTTTPFQTIAQFSACSSNVCSYTFTSNDNILPMTIEPGTPVTMFVKADIQGENTAKLGDDFYFRLQNGADVVAKGSVTQTTTTESGNFNDSATAKSYISPFSVMASDVYPTSGSTTLSSVGAGTVLGRFKVTNNGSAQVTLTNAKFTDSGAHTGTAARYTVYASSENSNDYTANSLEASSTDSVDFGSLTSTITINGGSYRYITVAITTVTSVAAGDTFSLSIASLGDLKYSVTEANLGYDAEQDGDITGTITGLYVDGKPALGVIQKQ